MPDSPMPVSPMPGSHILACHPHGGPITDNLAVTLPEPPLLARIPIDRSAGEGSWEGGQFFALTGGGAVRGADRRLVLVPTEGERPETAIYVARIDDADIFAVPVPDGVEPAVPAGGRAADLRGARWEPLDAALIATALAVRNWLIRSNFDPADGAATVIERGGWSRRNTVTGTEDFPRTDPAMITLVHNNRDGAAAQVLLGRDPNWPAGMFSLFAGFVEAGESLEQAVVRELFEEAGIVVSAPRYLGSQPWPFPRSLMLGFTAVGDPAAPLRPQPGEIEEARWFTRAEIRAGLDRQPDGSATPWFPGSISIARAILDAWLARVED